MSHRNSCLRTRRYLCKWGIPPEVICARIDVRLARRARSGGRGQVRSLLVDVKRYWSRLIVVLFLAGVVDSAQAQDPMVAFEQWRDGSRTRRANAAHIEEGVRLALARRAVMQDWIATEPRRALNGSLAWDEWRALPLQVRAEVETPFSARVDVLHHWGQADLFGAFGLSTHSPLTVAVPPGVYPVRIQREEGFFNNRFILFGVPAAE